MLYSEFINKAIDLTIAQADNGLYYLDPMWRIILCENELYFNDISDYEIDSSIVKDTLQLEVEKRNTIESNQPFIMNWLFDIITAQIDPTVLSEETAFVEQVTKFMKANHENNTTK